MFWKNFCQNWQDLLAKFRTTCASTKEKNIQEIKKLEAKRGKVAEGTKTEQILMKEKIFNLRNQYDHSL